MAPLMILDDDVTFNDDESFYFPNEDDRRRGRQPQQQQHQPSRRPMKAASSAITRVVSRHRVAPAPAPPQQPFLLLDQHQSSCEKGAVAFYPAQRKRVTFKDTRRVREIESCHHYSSWEKSASWYNRAELRSMKDEANDEALLLERGLLMAEDDDEYICHRGLETRTLVGARRRKENRNNAYAVVFFEVETQQRENNALHNKNNNEERISKTGRKWQSYDQQAIADVYAICSESTRFAAYMRGLRDAMTVVKDREMTINNNTTTTSSRLQQQLFMSCYGMMNLTSTTTSPSSPPPSSSTTAAAKPTQSSSSSTSCTPTSSSSSLLPSLPSLYWESLISSAA
jgi:hypothetical protein